MINEEIAAVLAEHKAWLEGNGGNRANLDGASLNRANLDGASLVGASLVGASLDGASLVGTILIGARLRGADLTGAILTGVILAGASLRGADLSGAYLRAADLSSAILTGANFTGANFTGAVIGKETIVDLPRRATRSDGYEFFLWRCERGYFIQAGCRFLDMEAARQHWTNTRQGTALGDESLDILNFFDAAIKRQGGAA